MRRSLIFEYQDGSYFIEEQGKHVFSINEQDLKFDAFRFYEGIYAGEGKSTSIELVDSIAEANKTGKYIFSWISEIVTAIHSAFPNEVDEDDLDIPENTEIKQVPHKIIPLFDFAACAGDGFYIDENILHEDYSTEMMEADYAVKISGHSMEPTIPDGAIVLVKRVEKLNHNDIGIFNVNGAAMCKRYIRKGRGVILAPDNENGEFNQVKISSLSTYAIQGKVIHY